MDKFGEEIISPWWVNPFWYITLVLLPLYVITVTVAAPYLLQLGEGSNNLDSQGIALGLISIAALAIGACPAIFKRIAVPQTYLSQNYSSESINQALCLLGGLSSLCYLIFLAPVALHPGILLSVASGHVASRDELVLVTTRIPGITSFIQSEMPFFALYGFVSGAKGTWDLWRVNRLIARWLWICVFLRGAVASERVAIVEVLVCYFLPRAIYGLKSAKLRAFWPIVGFISVFIIFAADEYFRTWHFYRTIYNSYFEFASVRFLGYFATSLNNGAGYFAQHGPYGYPVETIDGLYKLLAIFGYKANTGADAFLSYLMLFQTPEFNNPGGLFVPFTDLGVIGGSILLALCGYWGARLHRSFLEGNAFGILIYPCWYMGLLDIIRVWTWGSSRFVPALLMGMIAALILRGKRGSKSIPR